MMFRWVCYALADPDGGDVFYIGITSRDWKTRLAQHQHDPASAANKRCREIKARGQKPVCVVLKAFADKRAALNFERSMIVLIDLDLVNREPRYPWDATLCRQETNYQDDQKWLARMDEATYEPFDDGWGQP